MAMYQIVIIGAGPAGISTAIEALNRGFQPKDILILEKYGQVAHMISSKYPDEKPVLANYKNKTTARSSSLHIGDMTKGEFLSYLNYIVRKNELNIQYHQSVEKIIKLRNGQLSIQTNNDTFIANTVFVAIGTMSSPRSLGISIDEKVNHLIQYDIQNVNKSHSSVLVIGGGDSAGEYSRILHERGHNVTLSYRGNNFPRMIDANREKTEGLIKEGKICFLASTNLKKIEASQGLPLVHFQEKSQPMKFDILVAALGTERPANYLANLGIEVSNENGDIYTEASVEGVYFVGDLAASSRGGGTINIAFNSGLKAMEQACYSYLDCKIKKAA